MLIRRFLCASLLMVLCAGEEVTDFPPEYVDGVNEFEGKDLTYTEFQQIQKKEYQELVPNTETPCDIAKCWVPSCVDSGPPPLCPRNVTLCSSGCACISYCKDSQRRSFCYLMKYCRRPRRFSPPDNYFTTLRIPSE